MHDWFAMWSLSEKIAAIAGAAGLLQFLALISTIVVMVRNGRRQLRAYIFVENAWINQDSEDGNWKIKYRLKNFGGTPASKTKIVDIAKVVDFPMTVLPIPIERDYFGPVAPNGDFIECETKSVTGITIGEIKAETKRLSRNSGWRVLKLGKTVESEASPIPGAFDVDPRNPGRA